MSEPEEKSRPDDGAAKFPGVVAIGFWMLLEAMIGVVGVFSHHFATHGARLAVLAVATLLAVAGARPAADAAMGVGAGAGCRISYQRLRHLCDHAFSSAELLGDDAGEFHLLLLPDSSGDSAASAIEHFRQALRPGRTAVAEQTNALRAFQGTRKEGKHALVGIGCVLGSIA